MTDTVADSPAWWNQVFRVSPCLRGLTYSPAETVGQTGERRGCHVIGFQTSSLRPRRRGQGTRSHHLNSKHPICDYDRVVRRNHISRRHLHPAIGGTSDTDKMTRGMQDDRRKPLETISRLHRLSLVSELRIIQKHALPARKRMSGQKTSSAYAMIHLSVLIFEEFTIVRQVANFLLSHGPESRQFGKIPSGANIPSCPRVVEGTRSNPPSRRRCM
jgi:hypothetical protein